MKEFSIIDEYFKKLATDFYASQNLNDDAARISLKNDEELIVSKDLMVEDVHFLKKDGAKKIAAKLLLSNLSDLAASGAKPVYYMLGFSKNSDEKFVAEFCQSLKIIQEEYGISLIGGDIVACKDKLFFSLTIFGIAKKDKILSRKNAIAGDLIFVSGQVGAAYIGLLVNLKKKQITTFSNEEKKYFLDKHFFPKPQIKLGQELVKQNLSRCAIDISDGFLADLNHICQTAKLDAIIFKEKIPLATNKIDFKELISGGDDYELIFTCKKMDENKILNLAKKLKISLTCVGSFKKPLQSPKIALLDEKNKEIKIEKYGYEH
ncbi:MAG TPA: thiamine-phosphate kinase [Rickettsiales bacterium]|nr:thiamine-phosphate kinase [Rickettsiales bacterium]